MRRDSMAAPIGSISTRRFSRACSARNTSAQHSKRRLQHTPPPVRCPTAGSSTQIRRRASLTTIMRPPTPPSGIAHARRPVRSDGEGHMHTHMHTHRINKTTHYLKNQGGGGCGKMIIKNLLCCPSLACRIRLQHRCCSNNAMLLAKIIADLCSIRAEQPITRCRRLMIEHRQGGGLL